jgi:hypothetical protein
LEHGHHTSLHQGANYYGHASSSGASLV